MNMKLHGWLLVIVCCLVVELSNFTQKRNVYIEVHFSARVTILACQGTLLLLYPLLGHLTDVYLNRYRAVKLSFILLVVAGCATIIYLGVDIVVTAVWDIEVFHHSQTGWLMVLGLIMYVIGLGLFEANAIQFGLDQLLEAPTSKLIVFIYWFYWTKSFGGLVLSSGVTAAFALLNNEQFQNNTVNVAIHGQLPEVFVALACLAITVIQALVLIKLCISKKHLYIQKAGLSPFKNIHQVLSYAWKHKVPENRSAFTYWEEDIPPRIDLGKNKYGGPFTVEQVEDAKIFLCILPLLLCLFGYHLAGDGFSAPQYLQRTSCPSLPVLFTIVVNPSNLSSLVAVFGIPLYRLLCIFPKFKNVMMLTKIWVGLYLSLVQVILYIILVLNHNCTYWQKHHTVITRNIVKGYTPSRDCYLVRIACDNSQSQCYSDPIDNTYLWLIIPQLLNGLCLLLVSMTVLEFICVQAPRTTQGLLIGVWYATFSIRYLIVAILDNYVTEKKSWLIYEGVKGCLILLSLVLFSCLSSHYQYRKRDEIVNVQGMIEDIHEKWLNQEEAYMQERKAFYQAI